MIIKVNKSSATDIKTINVMQGRSQRGARGADHLIKSWPPGWPGAVYRKFPK